MKKPNLQEADLSWIGIILLILLLVLGPTLCQGQPPGIQLMVNVVGEEVYNASEYDQWCYGWDKDGDPYVTFLTSSQSSQKLEWLAAEWAYVFDNCVKTYGDPYVLTEQVEGVPEQKNNQFFPELSMRVVRGQARVYKLYAFQTREGELRVAMNVEQGQSGIMLFLVDPNKY